MIEILNDLIYDDIIYNLTTDVSKWKGLIIDRRLPHTIRLFTQVGDWRICLHRFSPIFDGEAFYHPHPWPGAFKILEGGYEMKLGRSPDLFSPPVDVANIVLGAGSMYEIIDPLVWHSVKPYEGGPTFTVMVNGKPFEEQHKDVKTTAGKGLTEISSDEIGMMLNEFRGKL